VIKQDTSENRAKIAFLAIGSNIGDKSKFINLAKFKLQKKNIKIVRCSSNYESFSWPNPKKPKFINIVIKIETSLKPLELLNICHIIEKDLGRKRYKKNDPRTCDIDIIDYDQKILSYKGINNLVLPHPEMTKRNFVLMPLFEISKSWKHPKTKVNIAELVNSIIIKDIRAIKQI
jgi:2-amino-4-hydroxy-6-hydroxymethyldihydropteridine diphosphokinase